MTRPISRLLPLWIAVALPGSVVGEDWLEVRSPHFIVVSNAGEKRAREVARELEEIRDVFRTALVRMDQDPKLPIWILAARNEKSFRELLPQYWEREGAKPAGVFFKAHDKHWVVLRVDANRDHRFRTIYHEYFHLLLNLNVRRMPVWLNEGLAEFWEHTDIRKNRVAMGLPSEKHIRFLARNSMMPLASLVSMDSNPHASDPSRVGVFYAQSWALTHMLMVGDEELAGRRALMHYLDLVNRGERSATAFHEAFGDVSELENRLRGYVRQRRMNGLVMDVEIRVDDDAFAARELSEARALAVRGNCLASGTRPDAALPLLEKALSLEPRSTLALESMGFYHFRSGERSEAAEWFARAVEADSRSFLSHYYRAQLAASEGEDGVEVMREALRQTISLNPSFAPAYAELGRHYALSGVRLESAYALARKAVELEPDEAWYWVNLGRILLMMEKPDEARVASEEASAVARTPDSLRMVDELERSIVRHERRTRPPAESSARAAGEPEPQALSSVGRPVPKSGDRRIEGIFEELRCPGGPRFEFVISAEERTYVLTTERPETIQLMVGGESVIRDMECGTQGVRVVAIYTPLDAPSAPAASGDRQPRGELRLLEFLEP